MEGFMTDQDKKPNKQIDESKNNRQRSNDHYVDYSEKMQSPEPWPDPPEDKKAND